MRSKKKKVFLGAYLNYINAQNLNCLALAKYLDKEKFTVYALTFPLGNNNEALEQLGGSVRLFHCFKPFSISKVLGFVWGILNCDIVYVPKHKDTPNWTLSLVKLLRKKIFTTIESQAINPIHISSSDISKNLSNYFKSIPNIFGITKYIITHSDSTISLNPTPLYLGVERDIYKPASISKLSNIVFIGSLIKSKNVDEILDVAKEFKALNFHIIGEGELSGVLELKATDNVKFYGNLTQKKIADILSDMDLHLLLSRMEGFPKVILETASAGIPSMVYNDYAAKEWINTNKNGFILNNKDEVVAKIKELIDNPELLISNAKQALKLAERFSWGVQIKEWEKEIDRLK